MAVRATDSAYGSGGRNTSGGGGRYGTQTVSVGGRDVNVNNTSRKNTSSSGSAYNGATVGGRPLSQSQMNSSLFSRANKNDTSKSSSNIVGAGGAYEPLTGNRFSSSGSSYGGGRPSAGEDVAYSSGSGGGGGGGSDNWIKQLIMDGWEKAKQLIENQYQQRMEQARQEDEANTRAINRNYMMNNRRIKDMYGSSEGGTGYTNMAYNGQNWASKLADARKSYSQVKSNIANTRDTDYLNSLNTIANQYSNYVLNWDYAKMMADLNRG